MTMHDYSSFNTLRKCELALMKLPGDPSISTWPENVQNWHSKYNGNVDYAQKMFYSIALSIALNLHSMTPHAYCCNPKRAWSHINHESSLDHIVEVMLGAD